MPTLKEIKGRIASVRSTLKITSAMKLVSSAKLRKAQKAIEAMRLYESELRQMQEAAGDYPAVEGVAPSPTAIIAIASNSSLCGSFNANAVGKVRSVRKSGDVVYSIGRKMADAMRRDGFPSPADFSALAEHPAYGSMSALVEQLQQSLSEGRFRRVLLVYNHFASTARQEATVDVLLGEIPGHAGNDEGGGGVDSPVMPDSDRASDAFLLEPSRHALREALGQKLLRLKAYAALLDSAAAEHAARTVAMQTATDNAEELLRELTLQYNKGRQQKITAEILDLAGGQAQE